MAGNVNPIPQWQEPAVDENSRWNPNWYKWIKPLLGKVVETEQRVDTVVSDVSTVTTRVTNNETGITGLDASITTETTARIDGDATLSGDVAAVAGTVTTLETTVNNNTTTVATHTTSINGLHGQWGVDIDVNEHVVGLVRLDGGASGSTFRVVSDKFVVQHPTNTGIFKTAFEVGLVGGVSTMVLNGDMYATGSITADALSVNSLDAVSADLGTITAGKMQSSDGKFVIDLDNKTITIET